MEKQAPSDITSSFTVYHKQDDDIYECTIAKTKDKYGQDTIKIDLKEQLELLQWSNEFTMNLLGKDWESLINIERVFSFIKRGAAKISMTILKV